MKKFRVFFVLLLAICLCAGIGFASDIVSAAQRVVGLNATRVTPRYVCRWFPTNNVSGYSLTNGGMQTMSFIFEEEGNDVAVGFMQYATKTDYEWVSGVLYSDYVIKDKILQGPTAFYQPYLWNKNTSVYINVKSDSYILIQ